MGKAKRAHRSLTELSLNLPDIPAPIRIQHSTFNITMEAAMRPIHDARHMAVLDRIEVNIVDVTFEIRIVSDRVLPKAALPDSLFSFDDLARRTRLIGKTTREAAFDQAPSNGEIQV